jgi:hypothetical protein
MTYLATLMALRSVVAIRAGAMTATTITVAATTSSSATLSTTTVHGNICKGLMPMPSQQSQTPSKDIRHEFLRIKFLVGRFHLVDQLLHLAVVFRDHERPLDS